jgi:DNA-binding NarL/FixJ family response regulator
MGDLWHLSDCGGGTRILGEDGGGGRGHRTIEDTLAGDRPGRTSSCIPVSDKSTSEVRVARLAIYQPDARAGARLMAALGSVHELLPCASWEELTEALQAATVEGCLLDADHPSLEEAIPRIHSLRARYPDFALIGFTERDMAVQYFGLGASGMEGFVAATAGGMTTRNAVDEALAIRRGRVVMRELAQHVRSPAPAAVGWAVSHASVPATVEELARALGTSLRALREGLRVSLGPDKPDTAEP